MVKWLVVASLAGALGLLATGYNIGVLVAQYAMTKHPKCVQVTTGPVSVGGQFLCLALKDSYVCNVNGKVITYNRDVGMRDSACDTQAPTKFCTDTAVIKALQ